MTTLILIGLIVIAFFQYLFGRRQKVLLEKMGHLLEKIGQQKRVDGVIYADTDSGKERIEGVIYAD